MYKSVGYKAVLIEKTSYCYIFLLNSEKTLVCLHATNEGVLNHIEDVRVMI